MARRLEWNLPVNVPTAAECIERPPSPYRLYVVRAGDTLTGIAQKTLGNARRYREIAELNREIIRDVNRIYAGQRLKIPHGVSEPNGTGATKPESPAGWLPKYPSSSVSTPAADPAKNQTRPDSIDGPGELKNLALDGVEDPTFPAADAVVAAFNKLAGHTTFTAQLNHYTLTNKDLSEADFAAAIKTLFGPNVEVTTKGQFIWKAGQGIDPAYSAKIVAKLGSVTVTPSGKVTVKDGTKTTALRLDLAKAIAAWGPESGIDGTAKVPLKDGKPADQEFRAGVFKQFKQLGSEGSIKGRVDATVFTKNSKVDRVEMKAPLTVAPNKETTFEGGPKATVQGGKVHPGIEVGSSQVVGGHTIGAEGSIEKTTDGMTAGFKTTLVKTGDDVEQLAVAGLLTVTDSKRAAELKSKFEAGLLSGALGIGKEMAVAPYKPTAETDPARKKVADAGGFWATRTARFTVEGSAGLGGELPIGGLTIGAEASARGSRNQNVRVLSVHPTEEEALRLAPATRIDPPRTITAIEAMKPFEMFSETGAQSLGFGGGVTVGLGTGAVGVSVGREMNYAIQGELSRDIERLEGDRVRIRFRKGAGESQVKAVNASIGLRPPATLADDVERRLTPLVEKVAQVGFRRSWESLREGEICFDATFDYSTPEGLEALTLALNNDLSQAQTYAGKKAGGVKVDTFLQTRLNAHLKKTNFNISKLSNEEQVRWAEQKTTGFNEGDWVTSEFIKKTSYDKPFLPWKRTTRTQNMFAHETTVDGQGQPIRDSAANPLDASPLDRPQALADRDTTLGNAKSLLSLHVRLDDSKTSLKDLQDGYLNPTLGVLKTLGISPATYQKLSVFKQSVNGKIQPGYQALVPGLGIGDKRFGKTRLDVEAYVAPGGIYNLFQHGGSQSEPNPVYRTEDEYLRAYVDAQGDVKGATPWSRPGIVAAVERTVGASLTPLDAGGYQVTNRRGKVMGSLSESDIDALQDWMLSEPTGVPPRLGTWNPGHEPSMVLQLDREALQKAKPSLERAQRFASTMMEALEVYRSNRTPARQTRESEKDYAERRKAYQASSLYNDPEQYFDLLEGFHRRLVTDKADEVVAPLALLKLATPDGIYAHAEVQLTPTAQRAMIDAGQANIRRFGAVALLAQMKAKLNEKNQLVVPSPADRPLALAAATELFGDGIKESQYGRDVIYSQLRFHSDEVREAMRQFLGEVRAVDDQLLLPAQWNAARVRAVLDGTFGRDVAATEDGRVAFDNRGYGFLHFGDALEMKFGRAFGLHAPGKPPPRFPVLEPIVDEGELQRALFPDYLQFSHRGKHAGVGSDAFLTLKHLDGKRDEFSTTPGLPDWMLVDKH